MTLITNFFLLLICIAFTMTQEIHKDPLYEMYLKFLGRFNKTYDTMADMVTRFEIFKSNCAKLNITDSDDPKTDDLMVYGMTQFMDETPEEFENKHLKLNVLELPKNATPWYHNSTQNEGRFLQAKAPASWDWTKKGVVGSVKNQGMCGGCWAFSAIQNIESQYARKYGKLTPLSVQQLIDCDPYNSGCAGGLMHTAYQYIQEFGLMTAKDYLFQEFQGVCRYNYNQANYKISGWVYAGTQDEEQIKEMLYKYGPLAITINARILQFYYGGVVNVPYESCPYNQNHGVVIVGYGTTPGGLDYWILRNSWGSNWGENGNYRLARGRGLCGVNMYVVSALID
jgi:cathepsin F